MRVVERFSAHVAAVAIEKGFRVNHHKTRIKRRGARQTLGGIVVNQKLNPSRRELELLEAILTNCARLGPESQNREAIVDFPAHLEGRVSFVEMINRDKGSASGTYLKRSGGRGERGLRKTNPLSDAVRK